MASSLAAQPQPAIKSAMASTAPPLVDAPKALTILSSGVALTVINRSARVIQCQSLGTFAQYRTFLLPTLVNPQPLLRSLAHARFDEFRELGGQGQEVALVVTAVWRLDQRMKSHMEVSAG